MKVMATSTDNDDLVICPICFERFTSPKYLPCLHTFCHLCLKSYIVSQLGGEKQTSKPFPCPVCRQAIQVPDPDVSSEKIADVMPGNHLITSLMERSQVLKQDQNERSCEQCQRGNQHLPAVSWCTVCLEALCENCGLYHERLKLTGNHLIVTVSEAFKEQPSKMIDVDEPCLEHRGEVLKVYCLDHKQMCCVICLATQHRRCDNISTFEEIVKGAKDGETIEAFSKLLLGVDEKTELLRTKTEENIKHLDLKHAEIEEKVCKTVQEAKNKLENQKTRFLVQLKQMHKEQNVLLTERKEIIEAFQNSVKRGYKILQVVCEQGSPKQVFITKEKLKMQIKSHIEYLTQDMKDIKGVDYGLNVDATLTAVTNTLASVATAELISSSDLQESLNALRSSFDDPNTAKVAIDVLDFPKVCILDDPHSKDVNITDLELTKVYSIDVPSATVTTGGTFLPDGKLVVCNFLDRTLKLYAKPGNLLFTTRLDDRPFDATYLTNNEIVVSFCDKSCLKRYTVTNDTFKEVCEIKCKQGPEGLAFTNDNIIIGYPKCVDIVTLEGKCLKSVPKLGFRCYVAASRSGCFYHREGDAVICRSMDGKELFRYSDTKLQHPHGIAVDCHGNMFLCGYDSKNLHIVSGDGTKSRVVMSSLINPFGIGFDDDEKRLFLTTGNPRSINIYDLSVKGTQLEHA